MSYEIAQGMIGLVYRRVHSTTDSGKGIYNLALFAYNAMAAYSLER